MKKFIGFLGPLGVGKSTIAKVLLKELKANFFVREPFQENPFWQKSQLQPKEYMLRSQIYFLLSNIIFDWKAKSKEGITISDTSCLTDILIWAWWYSKTGHLNKIEYRKYLLLVSLLKPVIPKPDILIILVPDSVENLKKGIIKRQKNEPWRKGELIFAKKDNNDLATQIKRAIKLAEIIPEKWQVPTFLFTVNPLEVDKDFSLHREIIKKISKYLK